MGLASEVGSARPRSTISSLFIDTNFDYMQNGNTALIVASMWGQSDATELLVTHGADVNSQNKVRRVLMLMVCISECVHRQ